MDRALHGACAGVNNPAGTLGAIIVVSRTGEPPCERLPCLPPRCCSAAVSHSPPQDAATARPKAPHGANVFIESPKDGATVGQDVTVKFGVEGHRGQAGRRCDAGFRPSPSADRREGTAAARRADSERRDAQALRQGPDRGHDPPRARHAYAAARFRRRRAPAVRSADRVEEDHDSREVMIGVLSPLPLAGEGRVRALVTRFQRLAVNGKAQADGVNAALKLALTPTLSRKRERGEIARASPLPLAGEGRVRASWFSPSPRPTQSIGSSSISSRA